jgi:hypothetical protein
VAASSPLAPDEVGLPFLSRFGSLGVKGNQVRVGTNAPKNVAVHREEVFQRIEAEKRAGNSSTEETTTEDHPEGGSR